MNTQKQISHYRCIVAHPPNYKVGFEIPASYMHIDHPNFDPDKYPHLWEPVYKKEPLCHLPDEHGKMVAMYEGDQYWACIDYNKKWFIGCGSVGLLVDNRQGFATKAAAEAKALELNKVEHDNEKIYSRAEMKEARKLLTVAWAMLHEDYAKPTIDAIDAFLKQPIK